MKLIILRTNLIEGLNSIERAVSENSNLPILKNILIKADSGGIVFTSTNLELAVEYQIPGKVVEKGETTIPFSIFNSIIKNLNSERINLEEKNKKFLINTDNYEAVIQAQDYKEFPIIPTIANKNKKLKINIGDFKEALGGVIIAAQYSDIRPEISGVYFNYSDDSFVLAATDGFRLSEVKINSKTIQNEIGEFSAIVPLKTASELMKSFNKDDVLEISFDPNQVLFGAKNEKIISRLIDGNFPDYKAILPKQTHNEATVNKTELINAIKLASAFAGRANDITLKIGDGKKTLEVYSVDNSLGENCYKIPVKLKGEKFSLVFNWRYLLDGLKIYKNSEVILGVNSPDRPVVIKTPTETNMVYVAMPIKS